MDTLAEHIKRKRILTHFLKCAKEILIIII